MDLGESIKPHASRQVTTGDQLMVDNAGSMTAPAQEETEARSLPLLTYSVLGRKFVSLRSENNFALRIVSCWNGPVAMRALLLFGAFACGRDSAIVASC